ncbi:hypothetical protein, variant 1 [Phytophthora nicotianae CJ01A1]|uniref:Transcription factor CBF/NF-Y/archaeal histone domain-containing protein n=5 Tax=Phytophthora nicotianae TaxID=4792 RepID=W2QPW1_PHYN3|nr:hypothetical protein, variant 1 [Phytophthora nicotianae INRA-310]ETI54725.1 hypothetical protein, variant 1 [Phytophthora nicotianae P1569]ETK94590.1 hypothetical protein, variant 1 [Phytophthora nicotianae]ETO83487.1 hypothetical protein, variant 1 [Phytophthora nicotianae P1976]ETP24575.1 hypothetical protein, variant 1 [Phytophthora nicotianae CJ01A1]ETL47965.1 hypothetical protein, variant 1 [Phytophthora nicotianae]
MATLPKGSIEKLLREVVGDDVPISKETIDWVNECAGELLRVIGLEANTIAENASKKENYRISQEHAMAALEVAENGLDNRTNAFLLTRRVLMQNLGMQRYAQEIQELQGSMALESQKMKERIASRKAAAKTTSRDELLAEQTALFKQASLKASREGW